MIEIKVNHHTVATYKQLKEMFNTEMNEENFPIRLDFEKDKKICFYFEFNKKDVKKISDLFQFIYEQINTIMLKQILEDKDYSESSEILTHLEYIYMDEFLADKCLSLNYSYEYATMEECLTQDEVNEMVELCTEYDYENGETRENIDLEYQSMPVEMLIFNFEVKYGYDYHLDRVDKIVSSDKNAKMIVKPHTDLYKDLKKGFINQKNIDGKSLELKRKN